MHRYYQAIGFSNLKNKRDLMKLVNDVVDYNFTSVMTATVGDTLYADYVKEFAPGMGIVISGEMDDMHEFDYDYCFPYVEGSSIASKEKSVIGRHSDKVSFAGICEDSKVGISIIYYLMDRIDFLSHHDYAKEKEVKKNLVLSGLSLQGTIMMPIIKNEAEKSDLEKKDKKRYKLIEAARQGDEDALETLTLDDMDFYSTITQKVKKHDVYSLVDSSFMPYGMECDQYSVLGEITELTELENSLTKEKVYKLTVECNGVPIVICINKKDLFGEPAIGRRFKGIIWLLGKLVDKSSHS